MYITNNVRWLWIVSLPVEVIVCGHSNNATNSLHLRAEENLVTDEKTQTESFGTATFSDNCNNISNTAPQQHKQQFTGNNGNRNGNGNGNGNGNVNGNNCNSSNSGNSTNSINGKQM
ncbi:putative uncharacterized protein DDB_G0284715 [Teleopsis dalmanni]|uniref:putative uncharacterized protein DDB_G0284715 n=1 Tax=Teleopsis dalmanni TaxID=139649 RepID=UPI0018CEDB03|nr:putative uncharacterized protein DDB_G0284715 [Teleopsis dalmanni]